MKCIKFLLMALAALTLFTFSNCKKKTEEPQLPPETTTGAASGMYLIEITNQQTGKKQVQKIVVKS